MRHRKRRSRLGRPPDHLRALLANQVCSLIFEERIKTTVAKAKATKRLAEKMVTLGRKGTLHHRRQAAATLHNKRAVQRLFNEVAPRYLDREGGYTRIIRLGNRRGDAAPMCLLEWVEEGPVEKKHKKTEEAVAEEAATETGTEATEEPVGSRPEAAEESDMAAPTSRGAEEAEAETEDDEPDAGGEKEEESK